MISVIVEPPAIVAYSSNDTPVLHTGQLKAARLSLPIKSDRSLIIAEEIENSVAQTPLSPEQQPSLAVTQHQGTFTLAQNPQTAGRAPSLQPTPSSPEETPFQPQRVPLQPLQETEQIYGSTPSITVLTPSAYGKFFGQASVGLGLQSRARFTNKADGVAGVSIGVGNPQQAVGLDIGLNVVDLDSFTDGTLSVKLHRRLPDDLAIAVGVNNAIRLGNTDGGSSGYGVVTKMFRLQDTVDKPWSRLYLSAGVGGGQFRSESDVNNRIDSLGVFGSAAVRVAQPVSAIAEWTGQDLTLGLSITPFRNLPLVITPAVTDITGNAGDGTRFILGIGYGASF